MSAMIYNRFGDIPPFTPSGNYTVNVAWGYLEEQLKVFARDMVLHLDPDYQRAHVWTEDKQVAYVEYVLRGGVSSRTIYWNSPGWGKGTTTHPHPTDIYLVDGKQRLQAVRRFLADEIPAFGTRRSGYLDRPNSIRPDFVFTVNDLDTRAEMLQWYLDLNAGGVVHTAGELDKVRRMLDVERAVAAAIPVGKQRE